MRKEEVYGHVAAVSERYSLSQPKRKLRSCGKYL